MTNMEMGLDQMGDVNQIGAPCRWADIVIAVSLIVVSVCGTLCNCLALTLFAKEFIAARNTSDNNKFYFKYVYLVICVTDLLICISVFPVVDAFIEDPNYPEFKTPILFRNHFFCNVWGLLWEILPSFSVFLVGVLSISRLILLLKPRFKFGITLMCIVMATYVLLIFAVKLILLLTTDVMDYEPMLRYCFLISHNDNQFRTHEIVTLGIMVSQLALPILPVTLCFILSLVLLLGPKYRTSQCNNFNSPQDKAAVTVVIITVVFIVFNIPMLINNIFYIHGLTTKQNATFTDIYDSVWTFYYSWPLAYIVSVAINSTVNPIIYYFRMQNFKKFVNRNVCSLRIHVNNKIRDLISVNFEEIM